MGNFGDFGFRETHDEVADATVLPVPAIADLLQRFVLRPGALLEDGEAIEAVAVAEPDVFFIDNRAFKAVAGREIRRPVQPGRGAAGGIFAAIKVAAGARHLLRAGRAGR